MALLGLDARFWDVNQALADMVCRRCFLGFVMCWCYVFQSSSQSVAHSRLARLQIDLLLVQVNLQSQQLCCGISLLSLVSPEDLDTCAPQRIHQPSPFNTSPLHHFVVSSAL
jgi:hypothetical protein